MQKGSGITVKGSLGTLLSGAKVEEEQTVEEEKLNITDTVEVIESRLTSKQTECMCKLTHNGIGFSSWCSGDST